MQNKVQSHNNSIETIYSHLPTGRVRERLRRFCVFLLMSLTVAGSWQGAEAASGTWILNPVDNDWNNPANWSSNSVPGPLDPAFFAVSSTSNISIMASSSVFQLTFNSGASAYSLTTLPGDSLDFGSGGITNLSGVKQSFVAQTNDAGQSGTFGFSGFSAGSAGDEVMFTLQGASVSGAFGGAIYFGGEGGNAGSATLETLGGSMSGAMGGFIDFSGHSNAASSTITNEGGQVIGATGGWTLFENGNPSAANATIVANGGAISGANGGLISFYNSGQAGNSTLIANGGLNGATGAIILFRDATDGGTARVEVFGNANLDLREHNSQPQ